MKGRFTGYGTVHKQNECSPINENEGAFASCVKWSVTGCFTKGRRRGPCIIKTRDMELNGNYNKNGELEGLGTIEYLEKGKYLHYNSINVHNNGNIF